MGSSRDPPGLAPAAGRRPRGASACGSAPPPVRLRGGRRLRCRRRPPPSTRVGRRRGRRPATSTTLGGGPGQARSGRAPRWSWAAAERVASSSPRTCTRGASSARARCWRRRWPDAARPAGAARAAAARRVAPGALPCSSTAVTRPDRPAACTSTTSTTPSWMQRAAGRGRRRRRRRDVLPFTRVPVCALGVVRRTRLRSPWISPSPSAVARNRVASSRSSRWQSLGALAGIVPGALGVYDDVAVGADQAVAGVLDAAVFPVARHAEDPARRRCRCRRLPALRGRGGSTGAAAAWVASRMVQSRRPRKRRRHRRHRCRRSWPVGS